VTNKVVDTSSMPQVQGKKTEKTTGNSKASKNTGLSERTTPEVHKKTVEKVAKDLKNVAEVEEIEGNEIVSGELIFIAEEQEDTAEDTAETLEEIDSAPKWKTFLFGTDYKNLGQLRSTVAHNTNAIRKLTRTAEKVTVEGGDTAVQANIALLTQERDRLVALIQEKESQFSLLGWVSRLITGYVPTPIEDEASDETEGIGDTPPVGGLEGIGETPPTDDTTEGTGTSEPGLDDGNTEPIESNPDTQTENPVTTE